MKSELSLLFSLGFCTLGQVVFLKPVTAKVTPDGTTNSTVDVSGNDFPINHGDRAGENLFHSFGEFSVPTDGSVLFYNANSEQLRAQSGYQEFLQYVYNQSRATCRPYGSQCANCAENLARQIIVENQITNPRVQRDVYNAAIQACY